MRSGGNARVHRNLRFLRFSLADLSPKFPSFSLFLFFFKDIPAKGSAKLASASRAGRKGGKRGGTKRKGEGMPRKPSSAQRSARSIVARVYEIRGYSGTSRRARHARHRHPARAAGLLPMARAPRRGAGASRRCHPPSHAAAPHDMVASRRTERADREGEKIQRDIPTGSPKSVQEIGIILSHWRNAEC